MLFYYEKLILPLFLGTLLFSNCISKTETKSAFNLDSAKNEIDAWGDENTITTTGTYEHFLPDGKSVEKGKYMSVLKHVDGKLVSIRDIWNSNDAAAQLVK
jgi:hypothetical protein